MSWPELPVERRPGLTPLYVVTGATASGKTSVAHALADHYGFRLLSLDSMMVYRGMDIGTAKPTREERETYRYAGLDYVDPDQAFSTGAYLSAVAAELTDEPTLAVGGTGLYLKAMMQGLDASPPVDVARRLELDGLSVVELQSLLDPNRLEALIDPENPRRLVRAVEQQRAGLPVPERWKQGEAGQALPVLQWPVDRLHERIRQRVQEMVEQGLLEEAQGLGDLSDTSRQAIGYAEAFAHLNGELDREEMIERITIRTRQYAKRQRTWFRNQMTASFVEMVEDASPELSVVSCWKSTGPLWFNRGHE